MKLHADWLKQKIKELVALQDSPGVQPGDFGNNIFDEPYDSIRITKGDDTVSVLLSFKNQPSLRYDYDLNRRLIQIAEIDAGEENVVWNRSLAIIELLDAVVRRIQRHSARTRIDILSTLPHPLAHLIRERFKVAA